MRKHVRIEMVLVLEHVHVQHAHVVDSAEGIAGEFVKRRVNFDGEHRAGLVGEQGGHVAGAGADFEHQIGTRQLGSGPGIRSGCDR